MVWQDSQHHQIKSAASTTDQLQPVQPLQFAILHHQQMHYTHWDLLLELPQRELLATWRVECPPETWGEAGILPVQALPDHRRLYLDYQGPISGQRGTVSRFDRGLLHIVQLSPKNIVAEVRGDKLRGRLELQETAMPRLWKLTVAAFI